MELNVLGQKVAALETRVSDIKDLTTGVNELAKQMTRIATVQETMLAEQSQMRKDLDQLRGKDGRRWEQVVEKAIGYAVPVVLAVMLAKMGVGK